MYTPGSHPFQISKYANETNIINCFIHCLLCRKCRLIGRPNCNRNSRHAARPSVLGFKVKVSAKALDLKVKAKVYHHTGYASNWTLNSIYTVFQKKQSHQTLGSNFVKS